jgi:N-acyl-D-aspartate/D-glutamate deacylase
MLDLVVKNGRVVDGTGASGHRVDVALQGGTIATMSKITESVFMGQLID